MAAVPHVPGRVVRAGGRVSLRVHPRQVAVGAVLVVVVLALLIVEVGTGDFPVSPGAVAAALVGAGDAGTEFIVRELRLPRALCALLVGGALGVSGAVFQSLTRNPLGSPDIVGFQDGAAVGALIAITVLEVGGDVAVSAGALAGGALTALAVYLLAFKRGGTSGYRLILIGIAISALMISIIDYLLSRARIEDAQEATRWLLGSLNNRSWEDVGPLVISLLVLLPAIGGRGAPVAGARARRRRRACARRQRGARPARARRAVGRAGLGDDGRRRPDRVRRADGAADRAPARAQRRADARLLGADRQRAGARGGHRRAAHRAGHAAPGRRDDGRLRRALPRLAADPRMEGRTRMSGSSPLRAEGVTLAYDGNVVTRDLSVAVPPGGFTAIVGPNACGKSTLLRALVRMLKPRAGSVLLDGAQIQSLPTKQVARRLGLLPQSSTAPDGITVADLVARGRHPHQSLLRQWSRDDERAVLDAMGKTRVDDLADRLVDELSGGQRQRVWLAMALAQETPLLLLDEPTTFLDIAHQMEVLDLCAEMHEQGRTLVAVLHDLNHACRYATHLIAMREGEIVAQGEPGAIVDGELVESVFGLPCTVIPCPETGAPMVVPAARVQRAL